MRRKQKKLHKPASTDDKKLQSTLKRLGLTAIPGIEEVNLFQDDGNIIHFDAPKVQANISANTYVVTGKGETKSMQELLPGILSQLGNDSLQYLQKLTDSLQKGQQAQGKGADGSGAAAGGDDDDVPDVDFEETAKE